MSALYRKILSCRHRRTNLGDIIQDYKLKRGLSPDIERLKGTIEKNFPEVEIQQTDRGYSISYGALSRMEVWIENKRLCVDTESNTDVSDTEVLDTNKKFRDFLHEATGYTAKQRRDMAKKEAQKG